MLVARPGLGLAPAAPILPSWEDIVRFAVGLASGFANQILDMIGNASNITAPTAFCIKLHVGDPGAAGTSNAAGETTRKSVSFGAAASGVVSNDAQVQWTSYPNGTDVLTHVSFWDHITGGTFLGSDALAASRSPASGDTVTLAVGELDISLTIAS